MSAGGAASRGGAVVTSLLVPFPARAEVVTPLPLPGPRERSGCGGITLAPLAPGVRAQVTPPQAGLR